MAKKKWYGVAVGKKPGIYETWFGKGGAHEQIEGFKGARYKGFASYEEAEAFVDGSFKVSPKKASGLPPESVPDENTIIVYTDGGAINNPGPGGYGAVIIYGEDKIEELSGGKRHTTNNRMEMLAAIKALEFLNGESKKIILHTDSSYVVNAINKGWLSSWKKRGWKKADGKDVLNQDLWVRMSQTLEKINVEFVWVKGHAGLKYNERCDELANSNARMGSSEIDHWFEENKS